MKAKNEEDMVGKKEVQSLTDTCRVCSLSVGVCREEVWHIEGRGMISRPIGEKLRSWRRQRMSIISSAKEVMFLPAFGLFVSKITLKVMNGF